MKKLSIFGLLLALTFACQNDKAFTIEGKTDPKSDGLMAYLRYENESGILKDLDSVKIEKGSFTFKGNVSGLDLYTITIQDKNEAVSFVLEPGSISISFPKGPRDYAQVGGTPYNDQLNTINTKIQKFNTELFEFESSKMEVYKKAMAAKDSQTVRQLIDGAMKINAKKFEYLKQYPRKNPDHFMSLVLLQQRLFNGDTAFTEIKNSFTKMPAVLRESRIGVLLNQQLKTVLEPKKLAVNSKAPNFSAKSPEGKIISLESAKGKVTLIDFWASWCPPCRKENPNVVKLYADFQKKGFHIIGVSLDEDLNKWKSAIEKDNITWTQISNLQGWKDPIAKLYGVDEIPTTFLLDETGTIVARGLTGEALRAKVTELLK